MKNANLSTVYSQFCLGRELVEAQRLARLQGDLEFLVVTAAEGWTDTRSAPARHLAREGEQSRRQLAAAQRADNRPGALGLCFIAWRARVSAVGNR